MRRIALLAMITVSLAAAEPERGRFVENVAARNDPTQTYTLYLPSSYDAAKKHPLLFVFDPRSRGTMAADIFREAAEQYGWVLISSNQTRSDDDGSASNRAVRALLPEIPRYSIDPRRIYATGFSGTAMLCWAIGVEHRLFAGVIGVGGRLVAEVPPGQFTFAHFGFAGDSDFNNREMRLVDARLEMETTKPHRFRQFTGGHEWIDRNLAREAIEWMEVIAMKEQRRERDASFIAAQYERELAAARAARGVDALRRYREIARTYEGLLAIDEATLAIAKLESDAATKREVKELANWDDFEARYMSDVFAKIGMTFARLRSEDVPPSASVLAREFRIDELQRRAKRDGVEGSTARRLLEAMYTQTSFYLMQQLLAKKEYRLAAAVLGVATQIHPDRWLPWYNLGAAHARAGDRKRAYEALEKAIALGFTDRAFLLADEDFVSLRGEARFQALLASHSQ